LASLFFLKTLILADLSGAPGWDIINLIPYSPDLAPLVFHLFTKLKEFLGVKQTMERCVKELAEKIYYTDIQKLAS